jgi:hypothetical protein
VAGDCICVLERSLGHLKGLPEHFRGEFHQPLGLHPFDVFVPSLNKAFFMGV